MVSIKINLLKNLELEDLGSKADELKNGPLPPEAKQNDAQSAGLISGSELELEPKIRV